MEMASRYGTGNNRMISVMKCFEYPFREVREGDNITVLTDDAMDPVIWQAAMAWLNIKGADATLAMYPRRAYHCADPAKGAIAAAGQADVVVTLTTTCLNSGTPGLRGVRAEGGGHGKTPMWLMEEMTQEILCDGGGRATPAYIDEICELQGRIGAVYDAGKTIRVTGPGGTDFTADISGYEPNALEKRWAKRPFSRNPETGRLGSGTWPFGEVHVEPVPGSLNGTVVWDQTAHYPSGQWIHPVRLDFVDGKVVRIGGGPEAAAIEEYLNTYGDANSWLAGGEIAIGTNKLCPWGSGIMRSEKKRYGAMHFGIGTGADRGEIKSSLRLEGIADAVSIRVDDTVVAKDGQILV